MVPTMLLLMMPAGSPATSPKTSIFSSNVRIVPIGMTGGSEHWAEINRRSDDFAEQLERTRKQVEQAEKRKKDLIEAVESSLDTTNKEIQCLTKLNSPSSAAELKKLEARKQSYERVLSILKK